MKKCLFLIAFLFLFNSCSVNDNSLYTVYIGNRSFTELKWVKKGICYDEFNRLDGAKIRFKGNYVIVEQIK